MIQSSDHIQWGIADTDTKELTYPPINNVYQVANIIF